MLPQALSQTLLRYANRCRRAAYLYARQRGAEKAGEPTADAIELAFGTAAHLFAETMLRELVTRDEPTLYAVAEGEDPVAAAREVASLTGAIVDALLRDHPELVVPAAHPSHSVDHLRQIAYHLAVGYDMDPRKLIAAEQLFELDVEGTVVRGKLDVLAQPDHVTLRIDDFKSTWNIPDQDKFESSFQTRLYTALALFGRPVLLREDGTREELLPVGEGIQFVDAGEVYPRYLRDDGTLAQRRRVWTRQEVADWLPDLGLLVHGVLANAEANVWPAVPGDVCSECPSPARCPLGQEERPPQINSMEDAVEAVRWHDRVDARRKAVRKEIKTFAGAHGPIEQSPDRVWMFTTTETRETDWDGLVHAVEEAAVFGAPFSLDDWRRVKTGQGFGPQKVAAEEPAPNVDREAELDAKFGSEVPF